MIRLSIVVLLIFFAVPCFAQQDAQYTQYMFNTQIINPAYTGSRGVLSTFGSYRTQWIGFDGAPVTTSFSINSPVDLSPIGLGISFSKDVIGPASSSNLSASMSYAIQTSETYKLSFGILANINFLYIDYAKLNVYNTNDSSFLTNLDSKYSPNFGVGIYFRSQKNYFGIAIPRLLEATYFTNGTNTTNAIAVLKEKSHYYLIMGTVLNVSDEVQFKPATLIKIVSGAPIQLDISANFKLYDHFILGLAYRWEIATSALAGFQISDSWFVGYSYDRETTQLANFNSGSHEIFLRYEFKKKYSNITSPRFF